MKRGKFSWGMILGYILRANGRDVAIADVVSFPTGINSMSPDNRKKLKALASKLWIDLEKNKKRVIDGKAYANS